MKCWVCGKAGMVGKPGQCLLCSPTYHFANHAHRCLFVTCEYDQAAEMRHESEVDLDEIDRETFERLESQGYTTHYE